MVGKVHQRDHDARQAGAAQPRIRDTRSGRVGHVCGQSHLPAHSAHHSHPHDAVLAPRLLSRVDRRVHDAAHTEKKSASGAAQRVDGSVVRRRRRGAVHPRRKHWPRAGVETCGPGLGCTTTALGADGRPSRQVVEVAQLPVLLFPTRPRAPTLKSWTLTSVFPLLAPTCVRANPTASARVE